MSVFLSGCCVLFDFEIIHHLFESKKIRK